ncbi:GNAT family N-acetyltransferase [Polynucleobacter paneuropaeus]|nr:GNAT family N-acetyltransferase [Polynucleobacter paneuropaeus]MBT8572530.1 GNAT family N-acetyltransferase [Polynucleobacter paneuropaeus]MBT8577256.1 GNAT family N-acetyltransferase [Polynucleobacter paneuropaeus]MBT8603175.1 GNAT family N-acetyltransferase [Polynucleobacter paneuropaeus]
MANEITPEIRLLKVADIPHLIDCVRRCYGDSYPFHEMYDPVALQKIVDDKLMHSVVAQHPDGHLIGHCALTFDSASNTAPEAGKMIVDPDFRGHHIAESMAQKRIEIAKELDLVGFWTDCVTNHPYSQDEMISFGAQETGVLLGAAPSREMAGLQNFTDTRMSFLSCYLSLKENKNTIYLPKNHVGFVGDLAKKIKVDRTIAESSALGNGKSEYSVTVNPATQMANIKVQHIGEDFASAIAAELTKLESQNLAFTMLNLPISQEAAALAFTQLEDMGFFWGAWLPNYTAQGDFLRFQKLHESVNVDEIICARAQGEDIKKYVVSEWQRVSKK